MYGDALAQDGTNAVAVGSDGSVVVTTYSAAITEQMIDFGMGPIPGFFFVVSHDADGNVQWAQGYGGLRGVQDVAIDSAGDILLAGSLQGTVDFGGGPLASFGASYDAFVVKLDDAGAHQRSQVFGDTNLQDQLQRAFAIAAGSDDSVYVGGSWYGATDFGFSEVISGMGFGGSDGWLLRLDP